MGNFDIIAIGDITTDAFIRLKDASVNCDINREHCMLSLRFGDKVPYEFVEIVRAVGNSANTAVAGARLGLKTALVANTGDDDNGKECIASLRESNVSTDFISTQAGKHTNYHYVLWYEDERTILIKHESFAYTLPDIGSPGWIYLSSMGEEAIPLYDLIPAYLDPHPGTRLAFQPGTYQIKLGSEKLAGIYAHTDTFFCNTEEAKRILKREDFDIKMLLKGIRELGPKTVIITDGLKGAYACHESDMWYMPVYPDPKPPYERTGAGDAFSSTVISALAMGKTLDEALRWAPVNSMSVVGKIGAQAGLLSVSEIEGYLAQAPADYAPKKIS